MSHPSNPVSRPSILLYLTCTYHNLATNLGCSEYAQHIRVLWMKIEAVISLQWHSPKKVRFALMRTLIVAPYDCERARAVLWYFLESVTHAHIYVWNWNWTSDLKCESRLRKTTSPLWVWFSWWPLPSKEASTVSRHLLTGYDQIIDAHYRILWGPFFYCIKSPGMTVVSNWHYIYISSLNKCFYKLKQKVSQYCSMAWEPVAHYINGSIFFPMRITQLQHNV